MVVLEIVIAAFGDAELAALRLHGAARGLPGRRKRVPEPEHARLSWEPIHGGSASPGVGGPCIVD